MTEPSERSIGRARKCLSDGWDAYAKDKPEGLVDPYYEHAIALALDEVEVEATLHILTWARECVDAANIVQPDEGAPLSDSADLRYIIEFLSDRYESIRDEAREQGRREGLEEAAKACDQIAANIVGGSVARGCADAIRARGGS